MAHENFIEKSEFGCSSCICRSCLNWWSSRCPYGECYDEHRAQVRPYDKAHPNTPPRKSWSNWEKDQAYWCRGGNFYPTQHCDNYIHYDGSEVKTCLEANVQVFQDGYISCSIVDTVGCKTCYERFLRKNQG